MGDSAGGDITLCFVLYLKILGEKLPDAVFAISPFCDFSGSTPGLVKQNKTGIFASMDLFNVIYTIWKTEDMSKTDPLVSPLFGDWTGMPQTYLYVGTEETLYPEIMDIHVAPCYPVPAMDQYFEEITEFLYGAEKYTNTTFRCPASVTLRLTTTVPHFFRGSKKLGFTPDFRKIVSFGEFVKPPKFSYFCP